MITRRKILLALGAGMLALEIPALAQQEKRVLRIGYFSGASRQAHVPFLAAFREGMAGLRWVEGRDYLIDARYAEGVSEAQPALAAELVASGPDLLLTTGDESARLLAQRTKTIPIVFTIAMDPVGYGIASSLQRPGGNLTGLTNLTRDLGPKRLQLLKEAFPRVSNVALLFEPNNQGSVSQLKVIEEATPRLGMRVTRIGIRNAGDIDAAFKRGESLGTHAYAALQGILFAAQVQALADRAMRSGVPAIFPGRVFVEAGGLMSYGVSPLDTWRRAATYVDKILKGARPGDLPIEQPVKFELLINMKTAKSMGLTVPQSILLRADRVIE